MKIQNTILIFIVLCLPTLSAKAQEAIAFKDSTYTPYELLSSYYNHGFAPFKKKNIYVGFAFSLEDKQMTNTDYLVQKVVDGERLNYDIHLKGGYYTGDYGMIGLNLNYYQKEFGGTIFRDPDTLQSKSITRGYAFTPNFRSSVPLTKTERLSFFTEVGFTFGVNNTLTRDTKNIDEITKAYTTNYNFRVGLSPGITFFAMENFAFEVQLNVLGYELNASDKTVNGTDESRVVRQNVDFNIDLLSLDLGLAYYFGGRKR
jgi:hypothetical protein